jgi:hypothetical protein
MWALASLQSRCTVLREMFNISEIVASLASKNHFASNTLR